MTVGHLIHRKLMGNAMNAGILLLMALRHQVATIRRLFAIHADMRRVMEAVDKLMDGGE